jgi:hypothetical protein
MASASSSSFSVDKEEEEESKYDSVDTSAPDLVILTPSMFPANSSFSRNRRMLDGINRLLIDKQLGIGSFNKMRMKCMNLRSTSSSTTSSTSTSSATLCGCKPPNQKVIIACYPVSDALVFVAGYEVPFSNQVVICGLDYHVPNVHTPVGRCVSVFVQALYHHIELFNNTISGDNNNNVTILVTVDESYSMLAAANIKQIFRDLSTSTRPIHLARYEDGVPQQQQQQQKGMYFTSDIVFTHFDTFMSFFTEHRIAFHASCVSSENVVALNHMKRRLDEEVKRMLQAKQSPELTMKTWFPFTDETYCNRNIYVAVLLFLYAILFSNKTEK